MENENREIEIRDNNPMTVQVDSEVQMQQTIERAERYMNLLDKMRKLVLNMTNTNDWVDQDGKPYLQASGCDKVSGGFGVKFFGVTTTKEHIKDEKGELLAYTTEGYAVWNNKEVHEVGTATTRDKFFTQRKNKEGEKYNLPLSEIDPMNIKKKSHTNFQNRAIKNVLGLSFTWAEVEDATGGRITKSNCGTVNYNRGSKGGNTDSADVAKKRKELGEMILKISDGEPNVAKEKLAELTAYNGKPGKKELSALSEKQVYFLFNKTKKEYDEYCKLIGGNNG